MPNNFSYDLMIREGNHSLAIGTVSLPNPVMKGDVVSWNDDVSEAHSGEVVYVGHCFGSKLSLKDSCFAYIRSFVEVVERKGS